MCWRCGDAVGSYMHIWWDYPDIRSFWRKIFSFHNIVTSSSIDCVPETGLLSLIPGPLRLTKKGLLHFLAAARQTIAAHWKQYGTPPMAAFKKNVTMLCAWRSWPHVQLTGLPFGNHGFYSKILISSRFGCPPTPIDLPDISVGYISFPVNSQSPRILPFVSVFLLLFVLCSFTM